MKRDLVVKQMAMFIYTEACSHSQDIQFAAVTD